MQSEVGSAKTCHPTRLLCSLTLLLLISTPGEGFAAEAEAGTTLADMMRQAEQQVSDADEAAAPVPQEPLPQEPGTYLDHLSEIITGLRKSMSESVAATMTATLGDYLADPSPGEPLLEGLASSNAAAEAPSVASEDRSPVEQQAAAAGPEFTLVPPVPEGSVTLSDLFLPAVPLADNLDTIAATNRVSKEQSVTPAPAKKPQNQATGLSLAEMATSARTVESKAPRNQVQANSLSRLVTLSEATRPVLRLPSRLTRERWIGAKPHRTLRFPDPRRIEQTPTVENEAMNYPASASLARFLGGIEAQPQARRGKGRLVPVSLEQVRRKIDWNRAARQGTSTRYRVTGFSFPKEAFAGNQMTRQKSVRERRIEVMQELRHVLSQP